MTALILRIHKFCWTNIAFISMAVDAFIVWKKGDLKTSASSRLLVHDECSNWSTPIVTLLGLLACTFPHLIRNSIDHRTRRCSCGDKPRRGVWIRIYLFTILWLLPLGIPSCPCAHKNGTEGFLMFEFQRKTLCRRPSGVLGGEIIGRRVKTFG